MKPKIKKVCAFYGCSNIFYVPPSHNFRKFCGQECTNLFNKYRKHRVDCNCRYCRAKRGEYKGENNPMYGKPHPKETLDIISKKLSRPHSENCSCPWCSGFPGEKNGNWQGGKSFELYPMGWNKTFKEQIRRRDEYRCQSCGIPEIEHCRRLSVHHIDFNKKNIKPSNLITLCNSCHAKSHRSKKEWNEIFYSYTDKKERMKYE